MKISRRQLRQMILEQMEAGPRDREWYLEAIKETLIRLPSTANHGNPEEIAIRVTGQWRALPEAFDKETLMGILDNLQGQLVSMMPKLGF